VPGTLDNNVVGLPSLPVMSTRRSRLRNRADSIRGRLFGFVATASVLWAGFWGLVTWNVFTENIGAGAVIGGVASAMAALLPAAILYLMRRTSTAEDPKAEQPRIEIPAELRSSYRRLIAANEQAKSLVADGVIDESVLAGIDERIVEVIHLLSADATNQELGGRPSTRLRDQVDELTELLVGLVDAAVDRRTAALDSDNQAALALREALGRMRAEERGYRELGELDESR
jgi:hypothetical protein